MTRLLKAFSRRVHEEEVSVLLEIAAKLPDVIALGRGDPDFHTPAHIVAAAKRAIDANEHHYTHPPACRSCARRSRRTSSSNTGSTTAPTRWW